MNLWEKNHEWKQEIIETMAKMMKLIKTIKKKQKTTKHRGYPLVSAAAEASNVACCASEYRRPLWEEMRRDAKPDVNCVGVDVVSFERVGWKLSTNSWFRSHPGGTMIYGAGVPLNLWLGLLKHAETLSSLFVETETHQRLVNWTVGSTWINYIYVLNHSRPIRGRLSIATLHPFWRLRRKEILKAAWQRWKIHW